MRLEGRRRGEGCGEDDESLQMRLLGLALQVRILGTFASEGRRQKEGLGCGEDDESPTQGQKVEDTHTGGVNV